MALTNDAELANQMRRFRSHGITSETTEMDPRPSEELWNYQQIDLGFNYRMTDISAALGLRQLQRLDEFVAKRHAIAKRYNSSLANLPILVPWQHTDSYSSFHLYLIRLKLGNIMRKQHTVYESLRSTGILVNLHYIPVYRQPYYEKMGFRAGYCQTAEEYYSDVLSIPMYPELTEDQQDKVIEALKGCLT